MEEEPLIGIERHRLATDGQGVTTLAAFHGCPLHCKYCLNPHSLDPEHLCILMTPEELLDEVMIDDLYFQATGGGITFGGGEPLLRSSFIRKFIEIAPKEWHFTLETSLNVAQHHLEEVLPLIHEFYIDIKDMNPDIYKAYSGISNKRVIDNLRLLSSHQTDKKITIRLPHIPDFNEDADRDSSEQQLREMGFNDFDRFEYITDRKEIGLA